MDATQAPNHILTVSIKGTVSIEIVIEASSDSVLFLQMRSEEPEMSAPYGLVQGHWDILSELKAALVLADMFIGWGCRRLESGHC
jgi:hypothetical protein